MICKEYFTIYLTWKAPQNHTYLEVQIIPEEKAVQEKKKKKISQKKQTLMARRVLVSVPLL